MDTAPAQTRLITGEELLAMGDIGPCELIDGEIIPMSPAGGLHGWIESTLGRALGTFVEEYFAIGVDRVWVVVPRTRSVLVYESPTTLRQLKEGDILEGEGVLEGFTLPVVRLFASRRDED